MIANNFPGIASRVMPRWFEHTSLFSFVIPKAENDFPFPIIGDGFLDPYNVDYVRRPLNPRVPAFLEQLCSDGTYARGSSIF